jgi:methylenetetrahydrofolate dehydrogenase (NADP+)/methenyltetrahydrofolate cyclohydrolase
LSARILDGKQTAAVVRAEVKERVRALASRGVHVRLDVLVAVQDPASVAYVRMKRKACEEAGIESRAHEIGPETKQHPLPRHLDEGAALQALGANKDVDGITPQSLGALVADLPGFVCATPLGIMKLLERYEIALEGKRAVVIGRSVILGKPAALMLLRKNATVTIAHSRTRNLPELCREADVLVAAVGRPEMIRGDWIKPGAVVVDAGYNKVEGRQGDVGDVDFQGAAKVASWITPVPGGVGPMTVASLLSNTADAAEATARR